MGVKQIRKGTYEALKRWLDAEYRDTVREYRTVRRSQSVNVREYRGHNGGILYLYKYDNGIYGLEVIP